MRLASATVQAAPGAAGMPLLEAVRERLWLAEEQGSGDEDFSAVMRLLA
jgi:3-hydroxyisobutyrate dehydrogenase-like beta-hydroxyacid dehydrogenase